MFSSAELSDLLQICVEIRQDTKDVSQEDFIKESTLYDSVVRALHRIGETASNLPQSTYEALPNVPWTQIIDLRLIDHEVSSGGGPSVVWTAMSEKVFPLEQSIRTFLDKNSGG